MVLTKQQCFGPGFPFRHFLAREDLFIGENSAQKSFEKTRILGPSTDVKRGGGGFGGRGEMDSGQAPARSDRVAQASAMPPGASAVSKITPRTRAAPQRARGCPSPPRGTVERRGAVRAGGLARYYC